MADPKKDDAAARARQDPVLFGPDPFDQQPGWSPPGEVAPGDDEPLPRPKWPMVAGILIVVIVLVGAVGIWVL